MCHGCAAKAEGGTKEEARTGKDRVWRLTAYVLGKRALLRNGGNGNRTMLFDAAGGGGHDIHFGIYREDGWGVKEAAAATTEFMLLNMDWAKKVRPTDRVSLHFDERCFGLDCLAIHVW